MGGITSNENQQLSQTRQSDVQKKSLQSARSKLYTDQNELQERSQFNSLIKTDVKLEEQVHHNEDLKNNNQMNQIRQSPIVGQDIQQVHAQLQLHIQQKIEIQQIEEFQQTQDDLYFQFQRQCVIEGHKRASILEYCLNKQCKESQRFICELCQKDGLHLKDMNFKQSDIIKQYQISDKIKQNYNSQVQIHNYCTRIVQEILKKCKAQVESLHQHVANLTTLINFNESRQSLLFLQSILKEQVQIGQIANDQLFKIVTEEPETYIFKQFHSIMDNFKLIQNDIEQLSKTSSEIPELQEKIWRILKDEKKEQQIPDPQQQDQDKLTDEILSQALLLVQQARFKQALEDLNKHLLENKNKKREGEIRITLGYTYYKEKDYPNSRIQYEEALRISNQCDLYNIYYYIGKCQLKQYEFDQTQIKFEDILKSFQQTLTLSPSFRKAYLQIAKMHLKVQNHELAVNYLMQGLELDKKNIKILSFLAKINLDLLQYNEALKYYDLCLDLNRNHLTSLLGKGFTLFKSNQYQKAIVVIDDIIKFNNQIPEAYLLKSDCFQRLNQDDQAIKILHEQSIRFKGDIRFKRKLELILIQNLQYNQFQ